MVPVNDVRTCNSLKTRTYVVISAVYAFYLYTYQNNPCNNYYNITMTIIIIYNSCLVIRTCTETVSE